MLNNKALQSAPKVEGIYFDEVEHTISYNPNRSDSSDIAKPFKIKKYDKNTESWAIFKEVPQLKDSGSIVASAFEVNSEWHFETNGDNHSILVQIGKVIKNFFSIRHNNVTVILPYDGELTELLVDMIGHFNSNVAFIDNLLIKLDIEEVRRIILEPDSEFRKVYPIPYLFKDALADFDKFTQDVDSRYTSSLIPDLYMRSVVENVIRLNYPEVAKYFDNINTKDVLAIDYDIKSGKAVNRTIHELKTYYQPKTITFVTLF